MGQPRVAVFKAKVVSVEWSSRLSPRGAVWLWLWEWLQHSLVGTASLHFSWAFFVPFITPQNLALRPKLLPSPLGVMSESSQSPRAGLGPLCPVWGWEGRMPLVSHLPPTLLNRDLLLSFYFPPSFGESGWGKC